MNIQGRHSDSSGVRRFPRLRRIAVYLLPLLLLSGCYSEGFVLNELTPFAVYGRKMTPIGTVETEEGATVLLQDSALAAVRMWRDTQIEVEFYANLQFGDYADIHIRAVPIEFDLTPSVRLRYGVDGTELTYKGQVLAHRADIRAEHGREARFRVLNDARRLRIMIDCELLYDAHMTNPATEFLVFETPPGGAAAFTNFTWTDALPRISTVNRPTVIVE